MNKTKLGISVNLLAAIVCLAPFVGGYVVFFGLALYILLAEADEWLKKSVVKAMAVVFLFGIVSVALDIVPGIINTLDSVVYIFGGNFNIAIVNKIFNALDSILNIARVFLLCAMSFMCLKHENVEVKQLDDFAEKHMECGSKE